MFVASSSNPSAAAARVEAGMAKWQVRPARLERCHAVQAGLPPGAAPGESGAPPCVCSAWLKPGAAAGAAHCISASSNALQGAAGSKL